MSQETEPARARLVGINHVALEVGDLDEALAFYGRIFAFTMRGRGETNAFVDMGDQFINFTTVRSQPADAKRHFGLVVDDRDVAERALKAAGAEFVAGKGLNFRDPWGNRIEVVDYRNLQFSKTPEVLRFMGLNGLAKWDRALDEMREKGILED